MEGCDSKGRGETGRLPVSACFHEPLLQGTGSSKEGLAARKATSWASPLMRLKDAVGWGGTMGSQTHDGWGREKSRIDSRAKRL